MWNITTDKDWEALECQYDWVADMAGVPQDPLFHAEGDVATHTRMVIAELLAMEEYQALKEQERETLYAAALLHDVEKRSTTVTEPDGRIRSPRHAVKGEFTARRVIYKDRPAPLGVREAVAKLVRHHGLPLWVFSKGDPLKALLRCSWEVDTRHLYLLAKADVLGRECPDKADLLDRVELFREYCLEQNCWGVEREFETDLARYRYFRKAGGYPDYVPFDDTRCEVTMLCGLPGMGKDTYIKTHCGDMPVVSLDDIRRELGISPRDGKGQGKVAQVARERMREHLRRGRDFVFNATNITKELRDKNIGLFDDYKARVRIVYLEAPYREWQARNRKREDPVPPNVLRRMLSKLEVPSRVEGHQVEYVVG